MKYFRNCNEPGNGKVSHKTEIPQEVNRKLNYRSSLRSHVDFSPFFFSLLRLKGRSGLAFNGSASLRSPVKAQQNHAEEVVIAWSSYNRAKATASC